MAFFGSSVNRVFMYGGLDSNALSEQITYKWNWLHNGWESGSTGTPPQGKRSSTRMEFFGGTTNLLVQFGGQDCEPSCMLSNNSTFTFDGVVTDNWLDCGSCDSSPQGIPVPRTSEGMAFGPHDPLGNPELVLFGGDNHSGSEGGLPVAPLQDTWTLQQTISNGLNWVPCTSSTGCTSLPPNRGTPGMDFDSRTSNAVVFGGSSTTGRLGDTWLFNTGAAPFWNQCTTTNCTQPMMQDCGSSMPPPCSRFGHRMVFYDDGTNFGSFMFGASTPQLLNDVWFFNGGATTGTWVKCTTKRQGCNPTVTPPRTRCCVGLAFDSSASELKVLLYGGQLSQLPEQVCADTWSWSVSQGWVRNAGTAC